MQNIKFNRINQTEPETSSKNPLKQIFQPDTPFLVLGSIRREEESFVKRIIVDIYQKQPETVIGLFPRHMHRIKYWEKALERLSIPWELRSKTKKHVHYGTILLWDTFGELTFAYGLAKAAFVGGSLVPLGGQNFLEALTTGIIPVIGPYWKNFAWVGREIIDHGLLREAADWREVSAILVENIKRPQSRKKVCKEALKYIKDRQGGTTRACRLICELLDKA
jgi:3-deoxy-D-manno-octulosonic-acid transferase